MKLHTIKNIIRKGGVAALLLPFIGFAQIGTQAPGSVTDSPVKTGKQLIDLIETVIGWVQAVFFGFAALFIIIAAFTYLTAGGDEEKLGKAKNMLIYAIVAIIVAVIAFGIVAVVKGILGVK